VSGWNFVVNHHLLIEAKPTRPKGLGGCRSNGSWLCFHPWLPGVGKEFHEPLSTCLKVNNDFQTFLCTSYSSSVFKKDLEMDSKEHSDNLNANQDTLIISVITVLSALELMANTSLQELSVKIARASKLVNPGALEQRTT